MIEITDLKNTDPDALTSLLEEYQCKPYWFIRDVKEENRLSLLRHQLRESWEDETTCVLGVKEDGSLVGFLHMNKLNWDSQHFGFDIVRLNHLMASPSAQNPAQALSVLLNAALADCRNREVSAIHARIPLDEMALIQLLERSGFRMMDVQVTYAFDLRKQAIADLQDRCIIRGYKDSDKDVFVDLARSAYTLGRFYADPHLSKEKSDELYAQWIKNSCEGQIADYVIVAEVNGEPVGYTTCVLHGNHDGLLYISIGGMILSAADPKARGRGCYTSMINGGLKWFKDKVDMVYLGTQVNNYPVQRAWANLGFRLAQASASLHAWLKD